MKALVIGGTGPTGYMIVEGLLKRDYEVTIYHKGTHELEFSRSVHHIHNDPNEPKNLENDLKGKQFDVAVSTSGRLQHIAKILAGKANKFVAISGESIYDGILTQPGQVTLPAPIPENASKVDDIETNRLGYLVNMGEKAVMEGHKSGHYDATIIRYPLIYGPHSYIPHEWYIVRRAIDKRKHIILEADGLTYVQRGHSENIAHLVMLAIEKPQSSGQAYNAGDEQTLSLRALITIISEALGHDWELVEMPIRLSPRRNPFAGISQHIIFDFSKAKCELGYRDVVPVEEATRRYAIWLRDNPPKPNGPEELSLGKKAFDYEEEDRAIDRWEKALATIGTLYNPDYSAR